MKNSVKSFCFLAVILFFFTSLSICHAWPGKVVSVTDGDTIKVLHDGKEEKIRLYGIDTPEKGQDFGKKAQELTGSLVAGKIVEVQQKDIDRYGRIVGLVSVDGDSLSELIINNGYAWVYKQYCKEDFCSEWIKAEEVARSQKKGMWSDPHIIPPWEWRHQGEKRTSPVVLASSVGQRIDSASGSYHGNVSSHKFHRPGCRVYDCNNCIALFGSRDEAISAGYVPCKLCNP